MDRHVGILVVSLFLAVASGCSESDDPITAKTPPPPSQATPRVPEPTKESVLERFDVGEDVYVRSLALEPQSDRLWVGTSTGVLEIELSTRELRNTFTRRDGLANEYVFAIGIDSRGYKWFGTNAGGASRYRDGEWQVYFPMHGLADYWVYSFAEQRDGPFWIGTWAGANSVDLESLSFSTYVKELVNEWVYAIDVDSKNRVWFGTEGGVSMYDDESWHQWTHDDGLGAANTARLPPSPNTGLGTRSRHDLNVLVEGGESYNPGYVFALHVDPADHVWAGTWGGGVARFDGIRWTNYTTGDGLPGNIVYSVAQDRKGAYWFGTNRGLAKLDGDRWQTFDRGDGLLGDHVYAIAIAPDGNVWAGTKRGVTRIARAAPNGT